jgi:hypothetical protein
MGASGAGRVPLAKAMMLGISPSRIAAAGPKITVVAKRAALTKVPVTAWLWIASGAITVAVRRAKNTDILTGTLNAGAYEFII